jgi:uncharacterized protein (TIGR02145 family)
MKNTFFLFAMTLLYCAIPVTAQEKGTITDTRDSKIYKTVKIGTQTWMAENIAFKEGNGCRAYKNDLANVKIYGYLYDWETAKRVCPTGWHLPNDAEWTTLVKFLGGNSIAGGKLKESGTSHWQTPNTNASNSSGFTALPGGFFLTENIFDFIGSVCQMWSATESSPAIYARMWSLNFTNSKISTVDADKSAGESVRCIKD